MKVYVTRKIPDSGISKLKQKGYEMDINLKDKILSKSELLTALQSKPYDAVLCLLTDTINAEVFDAASSAKIFANYAAGYNNIDINEAKKRGIIITNTPNVLTKTVAEYSFTLLLSIAHRVCESDKFTRAGKFEGWSPTLFLGTDVSQKILGVIGLGKIGSRMAHHGKSGFDMKIIYYDVRRDELFEKEFDAEYKDTVEKVLAEADFVSIHVPLLDSTKHLINEERLKLMKPTAYLINTSRGPVVDEVALVKILKEKKIKGAALDVFEDEPKLKNGLAELDNVILTPHIASATEETRSKMSEMAADNIIAVLEGRTPPNLVKTN